MFEEDKFFATGFAYIENSEIYGIAKCIAFVAKLNTNGDILDVSIIHNLTVSGSGDDGFHNNVIPYGITYDANNERVLVAGEKLDDIDFDPFPTSGTFSHYSPTVGPGKGFIMCLESNGLDRIWVKGGTTLLNEFDQDGNPINIQEALASTYERVTVTPNGYFAMGKIKSGMSIVSGGLVSMTRIEVCMFDFDGNILWQKSLQPSNLLSKSTDAFYSNQNDKIYLLYQNSVSHTFGLVALDHGTGTHGKMSEITTTGSGDVIASSLKLAEPENETIAIGGYGVSSSVGIDMAPFMTLIRYNASVDEFKPLDSNSIVFYQSGTNFNPIIFGDYFTSYSHNWSMFDLDKTYSNYFYFYPYPFDIDISMSYMSFKNNIGDGVYYLKSSVSHCNCPREFGPVYSYHYYIIDSPTLTLNEYESHIEHRDPELVQFDKSDDIDCGFYESLIYPIYNPNKLLKTDVFSEEEIVAVYNVIGKELYRGNYVSFIRDINKSKYSNEPAVFFIRSTQRNMFKKIVFVK